MTITLTVEEIRNYQQAMEHWYSRRLALSKAVSAMWLADNPMPTLLSSHLGTLTPKVSNENTKPISK